MSKVEIKVDEITIRNLVKDLKIYKNEIAAANIDTRIQESKGQLEDSINSFIDEILKVKTDLIVSLEKNIVDIESIADKFIQVDSDLSNKYQENTCEGKPKLDYKNKGKIKF